MPAVDTAPALAEGTASIEPASGAERATAARPEASEPGAYHKTGRRCETPQQSEASREAETPPQEGTRRCYGSASAKLTSN
jgi:hypothetical protein